jgi:arsenate reductase-like glutaredoxin family protein
VTQTASGKTKIDASEALALVRDASKLVVARGKRTVEYDLAADSPSDEELRSLILGRSGSLRAPAVRVGKTLLIGYNADLYADYL